jgi:hypothetical protein
LASSQLSDSLPGNDALANDAALQLGNGAQNCEQHAPGWRAHGRSEAACEGF